MFIENRKTQNEYNETFNDVWTKNASEIYYTIQWKS